MANTVTVTIDTHMLPLLMDALTQARQAFEEESKRKLEEFDILVSSIGGAPGALDQGQAPLDTTRKEPGESDKLIVAVLKKHTEGVGMSQLQREAGTTSGGTWRALKRLQATGEVKNHEQKWFWSLAAS